MSSIREVGLRVEFAVGVGVGGSGGAMPGDVFEIESSTSGGTSAIGDGRLETVYGGVGGFVIEDLTLGLIETGGVIPDELVGEADWVDATCDLVRLTVESPRRATRLASFDAGTATVVLADVDRRWDPARADYAASLSAAGDWSVWGDGLLWGDGLAWGDTGGAGEFAVAGRTLLRSGVRVRVVARHLNEDVALFTGFVESWPTELAFHDAAQREVRCHDWFGVLARRDRLAVPEVGAGETVTARLHRLLDQAAVPAAERDIGQSAVTMAATTLAQNLLTELKMTAACDGGDLWVTPAGVVTFRSRVEMMQEGRRWAPQHTAANASSTLDMSDLPVAVWDYDDLGVAEPPLLAERDGVYSRIELARAGGAVQVAQDTVLADQIGVVSFTRSDFLAQSDTQIADLAQAVLVTQPIVAQGVRRIVHDLSVSDRARRHGLRRQVGDRIRLRWADPVIGGRLNRDGVVAGIRHDIETPATWRVAYTLDDQTDIAPFTIEDSAIESGHFIAW